MKKSESGANLGFFLNMVCGIVLEALCVSFLQRAYCQLLDSLNEIQLPIATILGHLIKKRNIISWMDKKMHNP